LIYAGQLIPEKGVETALTALGLIHQVQPNLPVTFSVFGKGAADYEKKLKQQVEAWDIQNMVDFKGWVPRDQMAGILTGHDVLLLPSIWPEPLARITQEAMSSGMVVIGSTSGGTPEILQDGYNSLTFEPEDAEMLAKQIQLIVNQPKLRTELSLAARQTIEERFTFSRMIDEIENNFKTLVQQLGVNNAKT
jgi:glycosyltransferase involved in cell wall biosynthesis